MHCTCAATRNPNSAAAGGRAEAQILRLLELIPDGEKAAALMLITKPARHVCPSKLGARPVA